MENWGCSKTQPKEIWLQSEKKLRGEDVNQLSEGICTSDSNENLLRSESGTSIRSFVKIPSIQWKGVKSFQPIEGEHIDLMSSRLESQNSLEILPPQDFFDRIFEVNIQSQVFSKLTIQNSGSPDGILNELVGGYNNSVEAPVAETSSQIKEKSEKTPCFSLGQLQGTRINSPDSDQLTIPKECVHSWTTVPEGCLHQLISVNYNTTLWCSMPRPVVKIEQEVEPTLKMVPHLKK